MKTMTRNFLHEEIDGETIAIDLEQGEYWGINETGTFIWNMVKQGKSEHEIAIALSTNYDDPIEDVLPIIQDFIKNLKTEGFIDK